jgi:ABC-type branched-subunit amino acid transport system substrate-binding protein
MALNAINADPNILPNTELVFEYIDSKREAGSSVQGALTHVSESFGGTGADVVVGPASSGPSMAAQRLLGANGIPQMSYSASSPDLSDAAEYPTFFRTVASDAFQGKALASFLNDDLGYTNVCVVTSVDSYSAKGAAAFIDAANDLGMSVVKTVEVSEDGTTEGAEDAIRLIADSQCRVVFMMTQAAPAGMIVRSAARAGIMGPDSGWLWVLADAIAGNLEGVIATATEDDDDVGVTGLADADAVNALLKGSIGSIPLAPSGADYEQFLVDYEAQASTAGTCGAAPAELTDSCACDQTKDNAGNLLFQRDHDEDPATPDMCAGFVYDSDAAGYMAPNSYAYYAYDAVYAFARAAHSMVEDDGATSFVGAAIIDKLKNMDAFEGVTGTIGFETSGDREIGTGKE